MFDNLFKDESINVTGLTEELKAIYVYDKFIKTNKSILLVSSSLYSANNFYKSLKNYTDDVLFFPMDNFLTSEALAISPELENDRLSTINELIKDNKKIVVTNLMGYLRYLPSRKNYTDSIIKINTDDEYNIDTLVNNLIDIGYKRETIVTKTGEIAVRGFVVDIFPLDQEKPIRLEYWGDTIESIREFNVDTQLTVDNVKNVTILPMTERTNGIYDSISDYLDDNITVFNEYNQLLKDYEDLLNEIKEYNESLNIEKDYMHKMEDIEISTPLYLHHFDVLDNKNTKKYISYEINNFPTKLEDINKQLNKYIKEGNTIIICLNNKYQINKITDNIKNNDIIITNENEIFDKKINLIIKNIESGFIFDKYVVISEKEMFNKSINKIVSL